MVIILRNLLILGMAGLLASCAVDRSVGLAEDIEVTQLENLPAPRLDISYVIGPQEKLEIQVVGAESLSGTYLTDVDGDLAFPLIGNVKLDGRSPSEAAREIADRLRGRYLRDPQVRVIPEEFPEPTISVGGQVKKPGSYPATGRPTLLRAVNQAEGMTQYAKQSDVLVLRTVENQRYIGVYDIRAIQRGNYADPQLFPNDIVIVGDSPERRRLDLLLQLVPPLLTTATILIVQQ
ncbi:MAG: polysaccharide biosynthesis/export family protein [Pseudomonadota bacterium]|jgi:polysaccharide export outer membrane protein|uniref:polysaccharide biosynthesis/export family protein n=2 Tax=Pseudomonadota TaxID=1224 RepID=UPI0009E6AD88|nr:MULTISPECIES: polysaccharide biosynthesis/export family protein [unclassified Blastomonas]MAF60321.1 polysaccharide export protein [Blastomonas sp.]|tara:strand:- start:28057 stop:28761 length:705 start_codon:yes stop_codon:yes gene_type:complete